jgi:periplasmic protein TonB
MPRELFNDVVSPQVRVRSGSRYTMLLSVAAHALIVAAVIIVPLMATGAMPPLAAGDMPFTLMPATPEAPPLPTPPAPRAVETPVANRDAAPIAEPEEIGEELPPSAPANHAIGGIETGMGSTHLGFGSGGGLGRDVGAPVPPPVPAAPQKPLRPGGDIREPVKVKHVSPIYPQIAIHARIDGRVVIDAVIGVDGVVREARILSGVPLLNQAALDAVKQWRYTPTTLNNVPVPVIMTVTVQFNLGS